MYGINLPTFAYFYGKCRKIYHTLSVWVLNMGIFHFYVAMLCYVSFMEGIPGLLPQEWAPTIVIKDEVTWVAPINGRTYIGYNSGYITPRNMELWGPYNKISYINWAIFGPLTWGPPKHLSRGPKYRLQFTSMQQLTRLVPSNDENGVISPFPKDPWDVMGCQKPLFWGPRGVTRRVWCFYRRGQDP